MPEHCRIGIDIGGTKVNAGIVAQDGSVICKRAFPSAGAEQPRAFARMIADAADEMLAREGIDPGQVEHIGIGIPGTADYRNGIVEYSCNLFGEHQVPLAEYFRELKGWNPTVVQDSWAAAYAEYRFGRNRESPDMLCVTVGTGIGCGVISGGKVFSGAMHTAGEIGHTPIEWQGRPCACGKRGCLERYASGTAILEQAMERFPDKLRDLPAKAESVFQLAYAGDGDALGLIAECVDRLAYGLAIMIDILSTDTVVISGGISAHEALFIAPLQEKILAYGYTPWARKRLIRVSRAKLGSDAPMIGAAFLTQAEIG
ncbi:MAG TPA: ROK family protein [Candidatus Limiplasma sp.]|nr:ROK family protein [Candidatus Limiplasma sp.]